MKQQQTTKSPSVLAGVSAIPINALKGFEKFRLLIAAFIVAVLSLLAFTVSAEEKKLGKAADNKIVAQTLVFQMMKENPDLVIGGIHAVAPGSSAQRIVASTLDRIGADDDEGDLSVGIGGRTIMVPNLKNPARFGVLIPLKDASGNRIGALALAFKEPADGDETKMYMRAVAVRDQISKRIPKLADLFLPSTQN